VRTPSSRATPYLVSMREVSSNCLLYLRQPPQSYSLPLNRSFNPVSCVLNSVNYHSLRAFDLRSYMSTFSSPEPKMASSTRGSRSVLRGLTAVHIFSSVYPVASEAYHNFGTLSRQLEMLLEDQKGALRPEFSFLKSRIGQLHIDISGTRPRFITHRHVPRTFLRSIERLVPIMANILRVADNLIEHNNEIVTQHVISVKDITARADFCSAVQEMFYFCTELVGRTLAG
jgi:hypothetical protein